MLLSEVLIKLKATTQLGVSFYCIENREVTYLLEVVTENPSIEAFFLGGRSNLDSRTCVAVASVIKFSKSLSLVDLRCLARISDLWRSHIVEAVTSARTNQFDDNGKQIVYARNVTVIFNNDDLSKLTEAELSALLNVRRESTHYFWNDVDETYYEIPLAVDQALDNLIAAKTISTQQDALLPFKQLHYQHNYQAKQPQSNDDVVTVTHELQKVSIV